VNDLVGRSLTVLSKAISIYLLKDLEGDHAKFACAAAEQAVLLGINFGINKLWGDNESVDSKLATLLEKFGSAQMEAAKHCLQLAAKEHSPEGKQIHRITAVTHATGAVQQQAKLGNYYRATEAAMVAAEIYRDLLVTPVACREYAALAKQYEETHYQRSKEQAYAQLPEYEYNWEWAEEWSQTGLRAAMAQYEPNFLKKAVTVGCVWTACGAAGLTAAGAKGGFQHIRYALTIKKAREKYNAEIARLDEERTNVFRTCDAMLKEETSPAGEVSSSTTQAALRSKAAPVA